jgi:hypothetical protein
VNGDPRVIVMIFSPVDDELVAVPMVVPDPGAAPVVLYPTDLRTKNVIVFAPAWLNLQSTFDIT